MSASESGAKRCRLTPSPMPSESGVFDCRHESPNTIYARRPRPCHPNPVRKLCVCLSSRIAAHVIRPTPLRRYHPNSGANICLPSRIPAHSIRLTPLRPCHHAREISVIHVMSLLHLPEMAPTQIQYSEPHTEPPHHDGNGVP